MSRHQITLDIEIADGSAPRPEDLYGALEAALEQAAQDPSDLMRRIRLAEPQKDWVIRSELGPGLILTDQGTWYVCAAEAVPETALHGAEAGQSIVLMEGQIWCRRDLIGGEAVIAELHSDDRIIDLRVDIRPFLETATADEVNDLIVAGWGYDEAADRVAYALEGAGDPGASRLFLYLGLNPGGTGNEQVGFGLQADGIAALTWIADNRPDLRGQVDRSWMIDPSVGPGGP